MKVYQIVEGVHDRELDDQGLGVFPGHTGAVTLLHGQQGLVLLDTGSRAAWSQVESNLGKRGVTPEQINTVLLTHFHLDHSFNAAHFTNARVYGWKQEWGQKSTRELVKDLNQETSPEFVPGLWSVYAPGHDESLNAYFTDEAESLTLLDGTVMDLTSKRLCMSGDALNAAVIDSGGTKLPYYYDQQLYKKSAQKILDQNPNFIIPGHGPVIERPVDGWPKVR